MERLNQNTYGVLTVGCLFVCATMAHYRPCFDCRDRLPDRRVLLNVNGPVNGLIPHGRLVRPVNDVDLNFDCSRQHGDTAVLGYSLQLIRGSLEEGREGKDT